jgi:thiol-disulfide isomerase/thioredoxin
MNFFNTVISIVLFHTVFAYEVGDFVSVVDQNREFDLCYGNDGSFKLADYNGDSNGGLYYVTIIDMSATWCGPCQSLIPLFDDLQSNYSNNEHVSLFVALSDLNEPYSCSQWGNMGTPSIPNIIDDSGYPIFNMFNTESSFPSLVLIDHEMKIYYKEAGYSTTFVNSTSLIIDEMLFNMYNSLILAGIADIVHSD